MTEEKNKKPRAKRRRPQRKNPLIKEYLADSANPDANIIREFLRSEKGDSLQEVLTNTFISSDPSLAGKDFYEILEIVTKKTTAQLWDKLTDIIIADYNIDGVPEDILRGEIVLADPRPKNTKYKSPVVELDSLFL